MIFPEDILLFSYFVGVCSAEPKLNVRLVGCTFTFMLDTIRHVRCEGLYARSSKAKTPVTCLQPLRYLSLMWQSLFRLLTAPLHDPACPQPSGCKDLLGAWECGREIEMDSVCLHLHI
jgi:hypothetical protein